MPKDTDIRAGRPRPSAAERTAAAIRPQAAAVTTMPIGEYVADPELVAFGERILREGLKLPPPAGRGRIPAITEPMPTGEHYRVPPRPSLRPELLTDIDIEAPRQAPPPPPKGPPSGWEFPTTGGSMERAFAAERAFRASPRAGGAVGPALFAAGVLVPVAVAASRAIASSTDPEEAFRRLKELRDDKPILTTDIDKNARSWLLRHPEEAERLWRTGVLGGERNTWDFGTREVE